MRLLNEMDVRKITASVQTYNVVVDTLCKDGRVVEAENVMKSMVQRGIRPNAVTYNSLMDGYFLHTKVDKAR